MQVWITLIHILFSWGHSFLRLTRTTSDQQIYQTYFTSSYSPFHEHGEMSGSLSHKCDGQYLSLPSTDWNSSDLTRASGEIMITAITLCPEIRMDRNLMEKYRSMKATGIKRLPQVHCAISCSPGYILAYSVFTNFTEWFFANIFITGCLSHMGFSPLTCLMGQVRHLSGFLRHLQLKKTVP